MGGYRTRAATSLNFLPQRRLQPLRRPQQLLLQPLHLLGNLLQLLLRHQPSRRHLTRLPIRLPHRRTNPHRHPRQPILPSHHSLPKTTPPSYTPTTPPPSHTRTHSYRRPVPARPPRRRRASTVPQLPRVPHPRFLRVGS